MPPRWPPSSCCVVTSRLGGLNEITHAHRTLPVVHLALQLAHQCKCQAINAAGKLLADLAGSLSGILGSSRAGDNGPASFVGAPRQEVASQPNYVLNYVQSLLASRSCQ